MSAVDFLYLTADKIGAPTGGGQVTGNEWAAMQELANSMAFESWSAWSFYQSNRPWGSDDEAAARLRADPEIRPRLAHIYAGCFTSTVKLLKARGCKVTYTVAAHDRRVSREEHEALGLPFDYPHLTDPEQWARYIGGILAADVVIVPGEAPRRTLIAEGVDPAKIRIIPHGHNPPREVKPLPERFVVGYLGSPAPDKGLRYLLAAWRQLNEEHPEAYREAVLVLAGPGTEQLAPMVRAFGGGNVVLRGFVPDVSDFYNSISLYVQPSATEGFGIEVVEAMAHGRPVVCSDGAGAADVVYCGVSARNAGELASGIEMFWSASPSLLAAQSAGLREQAELLTWPRIHEWYVDLWRSVLDNAATPANAGVVCPGCCALLRTSDQIVEHDTSACDKRRSVPAEKIECLHPPDALVFSNTGPNRTLGFSCRACGAWLGNDLVVK